MEISEIGIDNFLLLKYQRGPICTKNNHMCAFTSNRIIR